MHCFVPKAPLFEQISFVFVRRTGMPGSSAATWRGRWRSVRMPLPVGRQRSVVRDRTLGRGEALGPGRVQLPVVKAEHGCAQGCHGHAANVILVESTLPRPGPGWVVLAAVHLDVHISRHSTIESANAGHPRLRHPRDPGVAKPQPHERLAVGLVTSIHQTAPCLHPFRRRRKNSVHSRIAPPKGVHDRAATGNSIVAPFSLQYDHERLLEANPPPRVRFALGKWVFDPSDPDAVLRPNPRAPIGGPPQPAGTPRDGNVDSLASGHDQPVTLQRRDSGEPATDPDGTHRRLRRIRHRVPPVPYPENQPVT